MHCGAAHPLSGWCVSWFSWLRFFYWFGTHGAVLNAVPPGGVVEPAATDGLDGVHPHGYV